MGQVFRVEMTTGTWALKGYRANAVPTVARRGKCHVDFLVCSVHRVCPPFRAGRGLAAVGRGPRSLVSVYSRCTLPVHPPATCSERELDVRTALTSALVSIARQRDIAWPAARFSIDRDVLRPIAGREDSPHNGAQRAVIRAGQYRGVDVDVPTISLEAAGLDRAKGPEPLLEQREAVGVPRVEDKPLPPELLERQRVYLGQLATLSRLRYR